MCRKSWGWKKGKSLWGGEYAVVGFLALFVFYFIVNIFVALSLIFIYFFPLEGEQLQQLEADLEELHKKKREKFASKHL